MEYSIKAISSKYLIRIIQRLSYRTKDLHTLDRKGIIAGSQIIMDKCKIQIIPSMLKLKIIFSIIYQGNKTTNQAVHNLGCSTNTKLLNKKSVASFQVSWEQVHEVQVEAE